MKKIIFVCLGALLIFYGIVEILKIEKEIVFNQKFLFIILLALFCCVSIIVLLFRYIANKELFLWFIILFLSSCLFVSFSNGCLVKGSIEFLSIFSGASLFILGLIKIK